MGKLSLGDRALPKLTDAFPQTHSAAFCGGGSSCRGAGSMRLSAHVAAEDVSWRDREAMKAKYAPQSAWQPRSRKLDVKFCNIRKVVPLFSLKDASFLHDTPLPPRITASNAPNTLHYLQAPATLAFLPRP